MRMEKSFPNAISISNKICLYRDRYTRGSKNSNKTYFKLNKTQSYFVTKFYKSQRLYDINTCLDIIFLCDVYKEIP